MKAKKNLFRLGRWTTHNGKSEINKMTLSCSTTYSGKSSSDLRNDRWLQLTAALHYLVLLFFLVLAFGVNGVGGVFSIRRKISFARLIASESTDGGSGFFGRLAVMGR